MMKKAKRLFRLYILGFFLMLYWIFKQLFKTISRSWKVISRVVSRSFKKFLKGWFNGKK